MMLLVYAVIGIVMHSPIPAASDGLAETAADFGPSPHHSGCSSLLCGAHFDATTAKSGSGRAGAGRCHHGLAACRRETQSHARRGHGGALPAWAIVIAFQKRSRRSFRVMMIHSQRFVWAAGQFCARLLSKDTGS